MRLLPNLPASASREVFATLCGLLPPPATATPEACAERDNTAMDAVAALHPADAFQAKFAAEIVAADAYVSDSLRLANEYRNDLAATLRCRARANSFMREMRALLRDYRRMQAEDAKALAESHPAAMERAGYWHKEIIIPEPPSEPEPVIDEDKFAKWTPPEQYAVLYPDRAARIRVARGLPSPLDFPPPDPDIIEGLVHGTGPILHALDEQPQRAGAPAT